MIRNLYIMKRALIMLTSARSQLAAYAFIIISVACFFIFGASLVVTFVFTAAYIIWAGWMFVSVFRSGDEVQSASVRHALAVGSGAGLPISLTVVMLMLAIPGLQSLITDITAFPKDGPPGAIGFAFGVVFTMTVICISAVVGYAMWWASKRS